METGVFDRPFGPPILWARPVTGCWDDMVAWCESAFGPMQIDSWTVSLAGGRFFFYYEEDRTAFLLRWA